jgi:lysozyme
MRHVDLTKAGEYILRNEGFRATPYEDTEGILTVGIGFNLEEGFTKEECMLILRHRMGKYIDELVERVPVFLDVSSVRKIVLLDMAYNLGVSRLLGFRKMLAALKQGDFQLAAEEMLDSRYAKQVKGRARRNALMMETGEWYDYG